MIKNVYPINLGGKEMNGKVIKSAMDYITMERVWWWMADHDRGMSSWRDNYRFPMSRECSIRSEYANRAKVAAYAVLSDIAEYYNKGRKPDWNVLNEYKWCIVYDHGVKGYRVGYTSIENEGQILFKNRDDAEDVMLNPNFRDIIDVFYRR